MSSTKPPRDDDPTDAGRDGREALDATPEGRRRFVRQALVAGGLLVASVAVPDIGVRSAHAQVTTTTTLPPTTTTTLPPTTTTTLPPTTTTSTTTTLPPTTTSTTTTTTTTTSTTTTSTTTTSTTTLPPTTTLAPPVPLAVPVPALGAAGLAALAAALGGAAWIADRSLSPASTDDDEPPADDAPPA